VTNTRTVIKGSSHNLLTLPVDILQGITLHRAIHHKDIHNKVATHQQGIHLKAVIHHKAGTHHKAVTHHRDIHNKVATHQQDIPLVLVILVHPLHSMEGMELAWEEGC
jgi:hypothetical protein